VVWVFNVVVPSVGEILSWEGICIVGIIDLIETAVVKVVPPPFFVDVEEFNG
jgi:hypothetical protein